MKAYEISNPSFKDLSLDQQIQHGINDWVVEDKDGNPFYGRTAQEAIENYNEYYCIS
jgi:hypothetical protein